MTSTPSCGHVIYISYDGMLEPLGESQVVAYLERLAPHWTITLISFEKEDLHSPRAEAMRARLVDSGIEWSPHRYHKRPMWIAKLADVIAGAWNAWRAATKSGCVIVHARGYLPAVMALPAQRLAGARLVFDIRGFWADERVDRGHWASGGFEHRIAKWWERRLFAAADALVSLTDAALRSLAEAGLSTGRETPVAVIPTCVDLKRFTPGPKSPALLAQYELADVTVLGCVGTMSRAYMRDEMLRYAALVADRLPQSRLLIVTQDDHAALALDAARAGIDPRRLVLVRATHAEMPDLIRLIDLGIFFIRPSFSARASAPTKLAELLATGVPVVTTDAIGDSSELVKQQGIGAVLSDTSETGLESGIADAMRLLDDRAVRIRCRTVAERHFDVEDGAGKYHLLYQGLCQLSS